MTENNKDKNYINTKKEFILEHPIVWAKIKDVLAERFEISETDDGKVILEIKNKEEK